MKLFLLALVLPMLSVRAQSRFDIKIMESAKHMVCPQPDEMNPVTLNAQTVHAGDSIAIIVKVSMAPGWHIYAYVSPSQPYIAIDQILQLPENVSAVGEWKKTEPEASSSDPGVLIYENEAMFIHKAVKLAKAKKDGIITAGLYYQSCNLRQCLPPKEETFKLTY
jgi:DsbC/DsbD-like thiol-disulfide interchange protein